MKDYNQYTYGRTLRFFEAYYPYDTEDIRYTDVMLSMNQGKTIDELIAIRERLKGKIRSINFFGLENKVPKDIIDELLSSVPSQAVVHFNPYSRAEENLKADINSCYDENLFRLFKESEEITEKSCGECFVNMTYCTPKSEYKNKIISEAKERAGIDVSGLLNTIARRYREFGEHWDAYKNFKEGMNGYNAAKLAVEDDLEYLKQIGWRLLPAQKSLYGKIDRIEIKKREQRAKLLKEKKAEREREEKQRKKEEFKKERKKTIIKIVIVAVVVVAILIGLGAFLASIDPGGDDDGTLGNWFVAIIFLLALLKGGKK